MEKIYFVMPTYNESENIEDSIREWYTVIEKINTEYDVEAHLVIADDGSKDDTFEKMQALSASGLYPSFTPLTKENGGHGQTLLFLYQYALDNGADYVFQTDSDGQTKSEDFWQLFDNRHQYDFLIGHRKSRQDGFARILVTHTLRLIVRLIFKTWVTDANAPFRLMQRDRLQSIMDIIPSNYFLCNVAISAIAKKWGYRVAFYPITFKPRQGGINSMNLLRIMKIGFKALSDFRTINAMSGKSPAN